MLKVASIFNEIGYGLEARSLFNQGLKSDPSSLYNEVRENSLAKMLMEEDRLDEAFKAFQKILIKFPNSIEAKSKIFEIANKFFEKKDYFRALKIYESGAKRWPKELNKKAEINFAMAEIYFSQKDYKKARKHFFKFLNLDPVSPNAHKALNRIGDSFVIEENYQNALAVFDESGKRICCFLDHEFGGDSEIDENLLAASEDADLVIWDGMFLDSELVAKKGWGHSSVEQGITFAENSKCKKIAIAHHAPNRTDEQLSELENNLPSDNMFFAAEKMKILV